MYPKSGVREGFHNASHHSNNRKNMDQFAVLNRYHISTLTYFFDKLKKPRRTATARCWIIRSSLRQHDQRRKRAQSRSAAGHFGRRWSGQLKGGRHMKYPAHTPMSNLLLAILDKIGSAAAKSFGDSTGKLEI